MTTIPFLFHAALINLQDGCIYQGLFTIGHLVFLIFLIGMMGWPTNLPLTTLSTNLSQCTPAQSAHQPFEVEVLICYFCGHYFYCVQIYHLDIELRLC